MDILDRNRRAEVKHDSDRHSLRGLVDVSLLACEIAALGGNARDREEADTAAPGRFFRLRDRSSAFATP